MQDINLLEELLLLTLEDSGGEFDSIPEIQLNCGLAGAVLMRLALELRIDCDLESVWIVDEAPTNDPILDRALQQIANTKEKLSIETWIQRLSVTGHDIKSAALMKLCGKGVLKEVDHNFLWVLNERRYPVVEGAERTEAKRRIISLLYSEEIPTPYDACLVSLANSLSIFDRVLSKKELHRIMPRIEQISRLDLIGGEIAGAAYRLTVEHQAAERRTIIAGLAGNVMEWYDFAIYGFFAATIGAQFFPSDDPSVSLISSFGVFAAGFIARPLGALLFGHIGDRLGRRAAVVISVLLMVVPTLLMALLPTYSMIGVFAPVLLILLRLAQGLAVGGEFTTSMVLLVEEAQRRRRGFVGSFAPFGALGGTLLGSLVGAGLLAYLPQEQANSWGWRLAFATGLIIGIVVFLIRRQLPPDAEILKSEEERKSPVKEAFKTHGWTIFKIAGLNIAQGIGFYLCFVYLSTWLKENGILSSSEALVLNSISLALMMVLNPLAGALSDRIGRKPLLYVGTVGMIIFAWPIFWLMTQPNFLVILAGQCTLATIISCFGGNPAFMVEAFPKHVRCTGLAISYNLAHSIFGGTVPLVATTLVRYTHYNLAPSFYLIFASIISLIMITKIKSKGSRLVDE